MSSQCRYAADIIARCIGVATRLHGGGTAESSRRWLLGLYGSKAILLLEELPEQPVTTIAR